MRPLRSMSHSFDGTNVDVWIVIDRMSVEAHGYGYPNCKDIIAAEDMKYVLEMSIVI